MQAESFFRKNLLEWHALDNMRRLPWKNETDPYRIWLSETMLQQTKASTVEMYYHRFLSQYPTLTALANAQEQDVFKLWEGLGYYKRCKHLIEAARCIQQAYEGIFPKTYPLIRQLKGVGDYTASAISSFAFGLPYAVLDGNVYRILARFFGITMPIDSSDAKKYFQQLSTKLLPQKKHALYNQAIMDFGATICTPSRPHCVSCILQKKCIAYQNGTTHLLPIKHKKTSIIRRKINYLCMVYQNKLLTCLRQKKDIWQGLYELYEYTQPISALDTKLRIGSQRLAIQKVSKIYTQRLTHRLIEAQFYTIYLSYPLQKSTLKGAQFVDATQLTTCAFPKIINDFLKDEAWL